MSIGPRSLNGQIVVQIYQLDNSYKTLLIDPTSTVQDVCRSMADKIGFDDPEDDSLCFSLNECLDGVTSGCRRRGGRRGLMPATALQVCEVYVCALTLPHSFLPLRRLRQSAARCPPIGRCCPSWRAGSASRTPSSCCSASCTRTPSSTPRTPRSCTCSSSSRCTTSSRARTLPRRRTPCSLRRGSSRPSSGGTTPPPTSPAS